VSGAHRQRQASRPYEREERRLSPKIGSPETEANCPMTSLHTAVLARAIRGGRLLCRAITRTLTNLPRAAAGWHRILDEEDVISPSSARLPRCDKQNACNASHSRSPDRRITMCRPSLMLVEGGSCARACLEGPAFPTGSAGGRCLTHSPSPRPARLCRTGTEIVR
jgi:hypothetical protein